MNRSTSKSHPSTKRRTLVNSVKKTYERFLKIRGHPREIALGFALGLFIAMTPFMGLHTITAVAIAALFQWNKISAAISVWITNAVTAPIIYSITYLIGAKIMNLEGTINLTAINSLSALHDLILQTPEIVWAMTVGGAVVGLPLAAVGYYVVFSITSRYQEEIKAKIARSKEKLAYKRQLRRARSAHAPHRKLPPRASDTRKPSDSQADPPNRASNP